MMTENKRGQNRGSRGGARRGYKTAKSGESGHRAGKGRDFKFKRKHRGGGGPAREYRAEPYGKFSVPILPKDTFPKARIHRDLPFVPLLCIGLYRLAY